MTQNNSWKPQEKNNTTKKKKDIGNGCQFHKIPTHNISECQATKSLVAELKASELDACLEFESESYKGNEKGSSIIDTEPNATIPTTNVHKIELEDLEEGEHLFHLHMWVKGSPLLFIIDNGNQNNLILENFIKQLGLLTTPHPWIYTIGRLHQGWNLRIGQQYCLLYNIKPSMNEVLCGVFPLEFCDVLLGQPYL